MNDLDEDYFGDIDGAVLSKQTTTMRSTLSHKGHMKDDQFHNGAPGNIDDTAITATAEAVLSSDAAIHVDAVVDLGMQPIIAVPSIIAGRSVTSGPAKVVQSRRSTQETIIEEGVEYDVGRGANDDRYDDRDDDRDDDSVGRDSINSNTSIDNIESNIDTHTVGANTTHTHRQTDGVTRAHTVKTQDKNKHIRSVEEIAQEEKDLAEERQLLDGVTRTQRYSV